MKIKMAVNTVTIKPTPFEEKLTLISKAGFSGAGIWMEDIQEYLKGSPKEPARMPVSQLLHNFGLTPVEMQLIRKWQYLSGAEHGDALKEAKAFFASVRELEVDCPVVLLPSEEEGNLKDGIEDFRRMCEMAEGFGIRVMLEFIGWAKQINNIKIAWEIVEKANCPNGGLLVDTFHFVKGGSNLADLEQVPMEKVFLVHVNDAKPLPLGIKEQSRGFRFFPGEGEAPIKEFVQCLLQSGYENYFCMELFNHDYWAMDPMIVLEKSKRCMEALFE